MSKQEDKKWMMHALKLAEKGRLSVSPNPMVGACVVCNGKLIASGYHKKYGESHAEVNVLKKAGKKARGATLYVTLEPCSTSGKTPPCTTLIKQSGIKKVIVGCLDPNPKHYKKGISYLRKNGIYVKTGILANLISKQNESFFKHMRFGKPFVTLKMAQSLDGKIATKTGKSKWISSEESRELVQELRREHDAILVGKNTFYKDNPKLNVRLKSKQAKSKDKPWKIVLGIDKNWSFNANILKGKETCVFAVAKKDMNRIIKKIPKRSKSLIILPIKGESERLDINDLLKKLGSLGIGKLLVEGGGEIAWSFLKSTQADRVYWIISPKIIGGRSAKTSVEGNGVLNPQLAFRFSNKENFSLGEDSVFVGELLKK